jgi:hypothetical protein
MPHAAFVALPELVRDPPGRLPELDREYLKSHARFRDLIDDYSDEQHARPRTLAEEANASKEFVKEFNRNYNFIYWMTMKLHDLGLASRSASFLGDKDWP